MRNPSPLTELPAARAGTAAVEFAIVLPVLLLLLGGLVDYGLLIWSKARLAASVAQGAQYAFVTGYKVTQAAITSVVQGSSGLTGVAVTINGPACYCLSGAPATLTPQVCTTACADGASQNSYVLLSASYTYTPLLPQFAMLLNMQVSEAVTVRLP